MNHLQKLLIILLTAICHFHSLGQVNKVRMIGQNTGAYTIGCSVNGINMNFIFDTGASLCSIGLTEALFLLKNGNLTKDDFRNKIEFSIADGSKIIGQKIVIRELKIGNEIFKNVETIIVQDFNAPLLLGQNIFSAHSAVIIDYDDYSVSFFKNFDEAQVLRTSIQNNLSKQFYEKAIDKEKDLAIFLQDKLDENSKKLNSILEENKNLKIQLNEISKENNGINEDLRIIRLERESFYIKEKNHLLLRQEYEDLLKSGMCLPPKWDIHTLMRKIKKGGSWKRQNYTKPYYVSSSLNSPMKYTYDNEKFKIIESYVLINDRYFKILLFENHGILYDPILN